MTNPNATTKDLAELVLSKLKDAKSPFPEPPQDVLNILFEALFFTSLQTEEGQFIKVTITFIDPQNPDPAPPERIVHDRWNYVKFENSIDFSIKNLVKLSRAADVWSSSLAVYYDTNNKLTIWGMIDQAIHYHSFLNYETEEGPEQPGLFQASITDIGSIVVLFDYELIASLKQNILTSNYIDVFRRGQVSEIIERKSLNLSKKVRALLNKEFPNENSTNWQLESNNLVKQTIIRILLRIQNYKHGGAVLITDLVPNGLDIKYKIQYTRLRESIERYLKLLIENTHYSDKVHTDYLESEADLMPVLLYLDEDVSRFEKDDARNEHKGAIRFVASLSCVDGLIVLNNSLDVEGFGAIITTKELPENIYISRNSIANNSSLIPLNPHHFGTRHRSMFSYCWCNSGSLGFIISQDGDIRAVTRIADKLIIWENIRVQQFLRSHKLRRPLLVKNKGVSRIKSESTGKHKTAKRKK